MIQTEIITSNGRQLTRTWSDAGYLIERDGVQYSEAVDPADAGRTYTETDVLAEQNEQPVSGDEFLSMMEGVL